MTIAVLRTEWLTALRRRRLFLFNILIPLTFVATIALSSAPAVHAAAVFTVLFALFGTFGSSIPLIRDGESGFSGVTCSRESTPVASSFNAYSPPPRSTSSSWRRRCWSSS